MSMLTFIESGVMLVPQDIDRPQIKEIGMAPLTYIRAALTGAASRRPAEVEFCDSCSQVCDSACRAAAHRARIQQSVLAAGFRA